MIFLFGDMAGHACSPTVNLTDLVANCGPDVDKFSDEGFSDS